MDKAPPSSKSTINIRFYEASPKEGYGFTLYLITICFFIFYLLWAFIPGGLEIIGIYYYPDREWAIIFPFWILSLIPFTIMFYISYNLYKLPSLESPYTYTDELANVFDIEDADLDKLTAEDDIPELQDIPLCLVNATLWGDDI